MIKRVKLKIFGQVQGVGFRFASRKMAEKLALVGWVRNGADGTVEIMAQGEENALKELISWCYNGSERSEVEKVDVQWLETNSDLESFNIEL